jgi:hypothetical protein
MLFGILIQGDNGLEYPNYRRRPLKNTYEKRKGKKAHLPLIV